MIRWLGLDDGKAAGALMGCLLFVVLLLIALPRWLERQATADFSGRPVQAAPGIVTVVTLSPISQGGGSLFNAVDVSFAGRQHYYALPPTSRWKPHYHQPVTVRYQIGRSGQVQIDSVTPTD